MAARDKYNALKRIADYYPEIYAIIFCRTRMETQEIADRLIQDGYNAEALHGDLSQMQRDITMQKFRQHRTQLLVATDVAARGLDVEELTHVINYGLPDDIESYTHRSGRTGRAGRKGTSISIIHIKEKHKIQAIERQIQKKFIPSILPTGQEICAKQLYKLIDDIEKIEVDEDEIQQYLPEIFRKLDMLDKEDLIKRMVSMQFNTFLNYYKNAPEIEQPSSKEKKAEGRGKKSEGRGKREDVRGKRAEGRWKKEEGRGKREEVRGKKEDGKKKKSNGQRSMVNGQSFKAPKGAKEWAKYFEGQVESQPFYNEFAKKKGKKKKR